MKSFLLTILSFFVLIFFYQQKGFGQTNPDITISGFLDVYNVYDFNKPQGDSRQPFLYNHNRHNEFNLNVGLIKLAVEDKKYRANLALQTGTYANDNYAAEQGVLKNIFEANVGLSLNKKNTIWLDAGILPSHIGFENAISTENLTLTRSLSAENSPYFLTGAKLSYVPDKKLTLSASIVNGWQRIKRVTGNSLPCFGTQINYTPAENVTLNWSTFIGTDDPDANRRMRYFNNIYSQFKVSKKVNMIAGLDFGFQQQSKGSIKYNSWFNPVIIGQYIINDKYKTAVRVEYYQDKTGIIISQPNNFNTYGYSWNFDYLPSPNVYCRIEARWLNSGDKLFEHNTSTSNNNFFIAGSVAIKFDKVFTKEAF